MGVGSFYNNFTSKTEGRRSSSSSMPTSCGKSTRRSSQPRAIRHSPSPIFRRFLTKALADPVWGWFVVNASTDLPQMWCVFATASRTHIEKGRELKRSTPPILTSWCASP